MNVKKNLIRDIYLLLFFLLCVGVYAQESSDVQNDNNEDTASSITEQQDIKQDDTQEEKETSEEKPTRVFTPDEQNIINSIKVSNNYDLLLWTNSLGLEVENTREELQKALLEFYGLPLDVFGDDPEKKEDSKEDTKGDEKEGKDTDTKEGEEETEDGEEKEKKKLVDVDVVEEELASGTADELVIRSANSARYFTYEKVDEDVFILQGAVQILVNQSSKKRQHLITTDKLIYNETTRTGTAVGEVRYRVYEYEKEPSEFPDIDGKAIEEFDSQVISFNIDYFNADILAGNTRTDKEVKYGKDKALSETLTFRIYSPHLSRSRENIIVVSNASFTSSKAIPPIYRIKLKNMWLLKPDEWAISRASIYVGEIPVMWIPFFVNPGDKFFFHPSIGFKTRTGGFINTTTYLIGTHKRGNEDEEFLNLFNFSKQKSKKKIIKGLYLREPEPGDKVRTYPDDWMLRYLLDYHTGLGGYTAMEGKFSKVNSGGLFSMDNVDFTTAFAVSETVYNSKNTYFTYYIDESGYFQRHWDQGYFFQYALPFRYQFRVSNSSTLFKYWKSDVNFELYSDSFLDRDFSQRSFDYSWNELLDPNKRLRDLNARASQKSSYFWQWNNNVEIPFDKIKERVNIGNYIRSATISNLRAQIDWDRKEVLEEDRVEEYEKGPGGVEEKIENFFFYPKQTIMPSYQASMSGTLLSFDTDSFNFLNGIKRDEEKMKKKEEIKQQLEEARKRALDEKYKGPGYEIVGPDKPSSSLQDSPDENIEDSLQYPEFVPSTPSVSTFKWQSASFNLDYNVANNANQTIFYDDTKITKVSYVDLFDDNYIKVAHFTNNSNGDLSFNSKLLDGWTSYQYKIAIDLKYRYLNYDKNLTDEQRDVERKSAENYTKEDLTNSHTVTLYPLKWLPLMAASNISYTADHFIGKDIFGTVEEPSWFEEGNVEDDKWWNQHRFSQSYNADYAGVNQTGSIDITLPPYDFAHEYKYVLANYFIDLSFSTKLVENKQTKVISYEPLTAQGKLKFFNNKLSFTEDLVYEYEFDYIDRLNSTLVVWWWTSKLNFERSEAFNFNKEDFKFDTPDQYDKKLRLKSWNNSLSYTSNSYYFWKDRVDFKVNTALTYNHDFIKFTNDSFSWSYGVNFGIFQYLTLNFSSSIKNDVVYMYDEEYAAQIGVDTRDFWKDVENGLALGDEKKLRESAFKVGTITFGATQDFGGWVLNFAYTGQAEKDSESAIGDFEWKNELEISVHWKPLPEFKSQAFLRDEKWSLDEEIEGLNTTN